MREAYNKNPSIVDKMREIAKKQSKAIDVRGGNASFGRVGLVDAKGGLDIVADGSDPTGAGLNRTDDPELTNPDKFVYIEKGTEPSGAMLAVAECWAIDSAKTIKAVNARRSAKIGGGWSETVIQTLFELAAGTYATSGVDIARIAQFAHGFEKLASESNARPWSIWNLTTDWVLIESRLKAHGEWAQTHVPVVFYQAWFFNDTAKAPTFLKALAAMNCREALPYLHIPSLRSYMALLIPATATSPPNAGQLRLALADYIKSGSGMTATTKTYLSSLVAAGAFTADVAGPMDGMRSDDELLMELGLHPRQQHGKPTTTTTTTPVTLPDANVDMTKSGKNDSYVEAVSKYGVVNTTELNVRAQPGMKGRTLSRTLKRGEKVYVMGKSDNWYLVDLDGQRGYVYQKYVDLQ
jgi:hypothetical protein